MRATSVYSREAKLGCMVFRLLGKLVWFSGKMAVKYVIIPIAITAATAVILEKLADRLEDKTPNGEAKAARPSRPARVSAEA